MKFRSVNRTFSIIFTILICGLGKAQSKKEADIPQGGHFDKIAEYLTADGGKWTGENKNYNEGNPKSPKAFGLWFARPMNNLLTLKIVAHMKDTTVLSSQGIFSWHPVKKQFAHIMVDRGNGFSEGATAFPNDSTFISTMVIYRPNGKFYDHKDENLIVDENTHKNTSYKKDQGGNWVENGRWTWIRDPSN